jgi:hypothetical protein
MLLGLSITAAIFAFDDARAQSDSSGKAKVQGP